MHHVWIFKEEKGNYVKHLIKTINGRKIVEYKNRNKNNGNKFEAVTNIVDINPTMSIVILNTTGINTPIRRQRLSQRIKKQDLIQEIYFKYKSTYSLKVKH